VVGAAAEALEREKKNTKQKDRNKAMLMLCVAVEEQGAPRKCFK
jgi:hypothetical protein